MREPHVTAQIIEQKGNSRGILRDLILQPVLLTVSQNQQLKLDSTSF